MRAGHYAGSTSAGGPISFDVTDKGEVTNVIASLAGTTISISEAFVLDDAGRWDGAAAGRGIRARMLGELERDFQAAGTVEVTLDGTSGDAYRAEWRARRIPGLAF